MKSSFWAFPDCAKPPKDKVLPGERLKAMLLSTGVLSVPGADSVWAKKARVAVENVRRAARGKTIPRCEWIRLDRVTTHPHEELPEDYGGKTVKPWGGAR